MQNTSDTTEKIVINYCPHSGQRRVHADESRFRIVVCGRRWGKTTLALNECIKTALTRGKSRIFFIAPTYRQAEMIAWRMLFEIIPGKLIASKNEVRLEITLINGSQISLKGADNEDSLRGVGLDFVVLDEYSSMKQNVWQEIVRPMLSDRQGKALFIGTPKGKNHFWELFIKGERKENGFSSYKFKTEDSPYIPRSEVLEAKAQLNERYFRQEYEASFEDFTGLIWPEYSDDPKDKIVIDKFEIPDWWETVACIDVAVSGTTAALLAAIDDSGTIHFIKEYYEQNKRASEVMDAIRHWNPGIWLIDPAAKIKNQRNALGELYTLYDEYSDSGIMPYPAENDVDAGINRFGEYLKAGKIKVFSTLKNYRSELILYHWAEERETVSGFARPVPYKHKDHLCDCGRYIVMSRPAESRKEEEIVIGSMEHFEWMEKRQAERRGESEE